MAPSFDLPVDRSLGELKFSDLGTPLSEVTFVVVDLETTGQSAKHNDITEIGAVKVRGGEHLDEFSTLVRPENSVISPFVSQLTGITNFMVADAPQLASVIPSFLQFAHGAVLVAHNARFDIGFLKQACASLDYPWPAYQVLDTVKLAQLTVSRQEVRNHKLGTLAQFFRVPDAPTHRALDDARATVGVLHGIFDRLGAVGVNTLEAVAQLKPAGYRLRSSKRHLAEGVPDATGVYMFLDGSRRVLYIGKAAHLKARVNSYFSAGETRGRMAEMVTAAQSVETIVTPTALEAAVREVRLIGQLAPPYNKRSKYPERDCWIRFTDEEFPRLTVSKTPSLQSGQIGPFPSVKTANQIKALINSVAHIKTCTQKYSAKAYRPCAAGEIGKCAGPCSGITDSETYINELHNVVNLLNGVPADFVQQCIERMQYLGQARRYEEAGELKTRLATMLTAMSAAELAHILSTVAEVQLAKRVEHGWEVAIVRYGRLAGSSWIATAGNPHYEAEQLALMAEFVTPDQETLSEERRLISSWAFSPHTLLLSTSVPLHQSLQGAAHTIARNPQLMTG